MQYKPQCMVCKHLNEEAFDLRCKAFPDGIPKGVLDNRLDHRRSLPNDRGIRWEPMDEDVVHPGGPVPEEEHT